MRRLFALTLIFAAPAIADSPSVTLDPIAYDDLAKEIAGLKGKVVLVDVWGTFCPPCREKFSGVVELHRKYAVDGLKVLSVSVDPKEDTPAAKAFLVKQRATFRNVILTDRAEVWQTKWKIDGPPILFLFDRQGQLVKRWDGKIDLAVVEQRVAELIHEK